MKAERRDREIANCKKKRRHPDEVTARAAASVVCEEYNMLSVGIYKCRHCNGWHVTTKHRARRWRVTAGQTVIPRRGR
jgi:hypothetical protein